MATMISSVSAPRCARTTRHPGGGDRLLPAGSGLVHALHARLAERHWPLDGVADEPGLNPALQYGTALVSAAVMATAISCVTQLTGPQTALRGIKVGALLWLGFELTSFSTEYVFEVRPWSLLGINAGFWLVGMVIMGAIVGAWKKK